MTRRSPGSLTVAAVFVASRLFYHLVVGLRFDDGPLGYYWQFIDPRLLETDLWRSVFYLHGQPPLPNLTWGIALQIFGRAFGPAMHAVHLCLGLGLALGLRSAMVRLGAREGIATVLASLFTASPTVALYESWLFYHHPLAFMMVMSVVALEAFVRRETIARGALFFGLLAVIVLYRGIFGIGWFLVIAVGLFATNRRLRRVIPRAAAVPLLVLALYAVKQEVVFGRSVGHAYLGPNLTKRVVDRLPGKTTEALIREGKLSPWANKMMMGDVAGYRDTVKLPPKTGIPVLDDEYRSTGYANTQNLAYLAVGDVYMADAKVLLRRYPEIYAKSIVDAYENGYFLPASSDLGLKASPTFPKMAPLTDAWNTVFGGHFRHEGNGWWLVVGMPALLLYGLVRAARGLRTRVASASVVLFVVFDITYVSVVTTFISWGDYARYRYKLDALYLVLLALALSDAVSAVLRLRAARSRGPTEPRGQLAAP